MGAKDPARATDIVLACRLSGLAVPDLWRRYVELGGNRSLGDLTARLAGQQVWPAAEDAFLAVAADEALRDAGLPSLVGTAPVDVRRPVPAPARAGATQAGGARAGELFERSARARAASQRTRAWARLVRGPGHRPGPGAPGPAGREAALGSVLRGAVLAVWETDGAGLVREDSPTWRAFTGQSPARWLGRGWLGAVHPEDRAPAAAGWTSCLLLGTTFEQPVRIWHAAAGTWCPTTVRAVPLTSPDGKITRWIGSTTAAGAHADDPFRP